MAWFKVDDKLHDHRKVHAAGPRAMGVWVLAGCWASDNLTDGFVPERVLLRFGNRADARRLVDVGLWVSGTSCGESGWHFHDWSDHQPSAEEVLERRSIRAESGRLGGIKSGQARRSKNEASASSKREAKPNPDPTRPDPSPIDTPNGVSRDDLFDAFWAEYPRRIGKGHARKAWAAAVKKVSPDVLVKAAAEYAHWCSSGGVSSADYIAHPSTWLNGERWTDERASPTFAQKRSTTDERFMEAMTLAQRLEAEESGTTAHTKAIEA